VPEASRSWFSELFGADRRLSMHEAVRRVLEAPLDRISLNSRSNLGPWNSRSLDMGSIIGTGSWICLVESFAGSADNAGTLHAVVQYAAESRARGVLRQWADFARRRPYGSPPRLRALTGAPWNPAIADSTLQEIRDAILWNALTSAGRKGDGAFGTLGVRPSGKGC
jgi:hypothetical protein